MREGGALRIGRFNEFVGLMLFKQIKLFNAINTLKI